MLNAKTNTIYQSGLLLIAIILLVGCEKKTESTPSYEKPEAVTSAQKVKPNKKNKGPKHPEWMITSEIAQTWAEKKVGFGGHTLPGSPSWQKYMNFLEKEFKKVGIVDMFRHTWTFNRWSTSEMPDTSKWSLHIGDIPIRVANYAAYSGLTGSKGVTAPLVFYNFKNPPKDIKGKIVVFRTEHSPTSSTMDKTFETLFTWPDYEFITDEKSFPPIQKVVHPAASVVFDTYYQLKQVHPWRNILKNGGAAGGLFVLNGSYDRFAGIESFIVPNIYNVPVLFLDESEGINVIDYARDHKKATLKLESSIKPTNIYQLYGYLPGKNYGTEKDEFILLDTHTDGPSISQENGALGLLGIVNYFSHRPKEQRERTLMLFLDSRHYYPGSERGSREHDFIAVYPKLAKKVVSSVSMEQLGQYEFREINGGYERTGFPEGVFLWSRNNQQLINSAIKAVKDNKLPRTRVTNIERLGIHGKSQGTWYGTGAIALPKTSDGTNRPALNVPGYALLGAMGGYWTTTSQLQNFDAILFTKQVSAMVQLTEMLMTADLEAIKPLPPSDKK